MNLNQIVTVKLTKTGREIYENYLREYSLKYPTRLEIESELSKNGCLRTMLWRLFEIFGGIESFDNRGAFAGHKFVIEYFNHDRV